MVKICSNTNGSSNSSEPIQGSVSNSGNNVAGGASSLYGSMSRLMYVSPLTPPISDPGSPLGGGPTRRTPPPPYPQMQLNTNPGTVPVTNNPAAPPPPPPGQRSGGSATSHMSTKFNRRNNPELEKRRVHHCDFLG